ncbi:MAG: anti-CBASS Acb1 family protein [Pseudomonadota bacterium]
MKLRLGDTLQNLVSSLGVFGRDKAASATFVFGELSEQDLIAAYRGDWIARKLIDIPAFDMTREWRYWQAKPEQITKLEAEEKRLQVRAKVHKAILWSRLFGGAALIMEDGGQDLSQPLAVKGVGDLKNVIVVSRYKLKAGDMQMDPMLPGYDEPVFWNLTSGERGSVQVHPSRVIPFIGNAVPNAGEGVALSRGERVWGDSVLQAVVDAVQQASMAHQGVASLLQEAKVNVIKTKNLMARVATKEYAEQTTARFQLAATLQSINNVLLLDSEEEWEQKQIRFAQLPEVVQTFMAAVCAAADVPATRFLGQAPKGLNATGDGDLQNYYDMIKSKQAVDIDPLLGRLDTLLVISTLGAEDPDIHSKWAPLWQLSDTDKATNALNRANAVKIEMEAGVIPRAALAKGYQNLLIEQGVYPGLEQAIKDAEAGRLLPFEEPEDPNAEDPDLVTPANENTPAGKAKKKAAGSPAHEIQVAGPGGLTIKAKVKATDRMVRDAAPRSLYIRRDVVNYRDLLAWARDVGLPNVVPGASMHVTLIYSKKAVDWMKITGDWNSDAQGRMRIPPGGARLLERMGPGGRCVVLEFTHDALVWRNEQILRAGAQSKWPEYRPHIALSWDVPESFALEKLEPYRGRLVLGPEIFEEIIEDWVEQNQGG